MSERWKMNRMGFVNFWLYDEEIFDFADGKLMLRGQNGSGKSITTQSFIPFILDGDRSPSRLDPFGSSDRRMEYYFLGDGSKDEATGYLFLEFKHGDLDRYRTIGIGQRAQKGKPMGFWGFVILDGRRIGVDLELYRRVGSGKIPLTKRELKELLGETNVFTDVQKEYMEAVNRHIFGFPSLTAYSQFIRLLIKIRAPKLSKEFKPTKVYEILDDSLQTLTDEDLRAMVEAMEKMDEIQDRLDALNAAFRDAQIIRTEYIRYNQFMLGRKAQAYLEAKKDADVQMRSLENKRRDLTGKGEERQKIGRDTDSLRQEGDTLRSERKALHVEDIQDAVRRRDEANQEKEATQSEAQELTVKIRACQEKLAVMDGELRRYAAQTQAVMGEAKQCIDTLRTLNETLQFPEHSMAEQLLVLESEPRRHAHASLIRRLQSWRESVRKALSALETLAYRQKSWDEQLARLEQLRAQYLEARQTEETAAAMTDHERDALIEGFYVLQKQLSLIKISREALSDMTERIRVYGGSQDLGMIRDVFDGLWREASEERQTQLITVRAEAGQCAADCTRLESELKTLRESRLPAPERSEETEEARQILTDAGIHFVPLYEAVDFAQELPEKQRGLIECQLSDAGLLDALIVSAQDRAKAQKLLTGHADRLLLPHDVEAEDRSQSAEKDIHRYLVPAAQVAASEDGEAPDEALAQAVSDVFAAIHMVETGTGDGLSVYESHSVTEAEDADADAGKRADSAQIWLWDDGRYRHGMVSGYARSRGEASYIGAAARRALRERQIAAIEQALNEKKQALSALQVEMDKIREQLKVLQAEREAFPSFAALDQALFAAMSAQSRTKQCEEDCAAQEKAEQKAKNECRSAEQEILRLCRPLPYPRTREAYEEVLGLLEEYQTELTLLDRHVLEAEQSKIRSEQTALTIEQEEIQQDTLYGYQRRANKKAGELTAQIEVLNNYLENPEIRRMAQRLTEINARLTEIDAAIRSGDVRMGILEDNIRTLTAEIETLAQNSAEVEQRLQLTETIFLEEWDLGLLQLSGDESDDTAKRAKSVSGIIRESDRNRSEGEITASLMKVFQAHSGTLSSYGTSMESCFADDVRYVRRRQRISSMWNGQKLYLNEFYQMLGETIESTALLIRQKDREMFEGILADTLSRKLSQRIRESRGFIKDMSSLMKQMETSMGLSFSLDWRPREAEGDGQLDITELERILSREKALLTDEDIERVSAHFRSKIHEARALALEKGESVNYLDMVREALDYRQWFDFRLNYYRGDVKKELTDHAFNRFSGGEKAMAMYVPLFAAVNAQYLKAASKDHPRIIALDEAFAGVDDKNIDSMFALVETLDFDYIMNSQVLWGCYESVKNLRIAELLRPLNSDFITVINYTWNGRERVLEG